MALTAEASAVVGASPREVLEFVLDLDRYREVDDKIMRVGAVVGPDADGCGSVRLWGRLRWLPPAPDRQDFVLEQWTRLTFTGAARQPARLVFGFTGVFECAPMEGGSTRITHRYEFRFRGPFRPIERLQRGWLQRQIAEEVEAVAARFGG